MAKTILSLFCMSAKNTLLILLVALCWLNLRAQNVDDALLNTQTLYEGTSRSMAMGGATGALGGDVTAVCINPAGIGLYRSSEMTFTTGLQHTLYSNHYYGENELGGRTRLTVPNFGYVLSMPCSNYKPLRYLQFGIALTRTNDFNYHSKAQGLNPGSSMVDAYLQTINGIDALFDSVLLDPGTVLNDTYPYDLYPAWVTYLVDRYQDSLGFYYNSPIPQGNVRQADEYYSKGRSEEWTICLGANISEKLFVGNSLGMAHIKRIVKRTYSETPGPTDHPTFNEWSHVEDLGDDAWGLNFKCGFIYYPARWFRFGMAWQSRTLFAFDEEWSTETESNLIGQQEGGYHKYLSQTLYNNYEFRTPHRFTGSLAFFAGRRGLFTADVDYLNYGGARFSSEEYSFADVNDDIALSLRPTWNFRLGTEWSLRQFYFRGGVAYYGSPFGLGTAYGSVRKLALGIGYATLDNASWDFAYELTQSPTAYTPYQYYVDGENIVGSVVRQCWRSKLAVTLKLRIE